MHRRLRFPAVLLILALLLTSCATQAGFILTGETLDSMSKQFVAVGNAYNTSLDQKKITVEQYRAWATFAKRFKQAYPVAWQGWEAGVDINDAALKKSSVQLITSLVTELAKFGAVVGIQVMGGAK